MIENDVHSRSRLAGYSPEVLFTSTVLIVGLGAVGQNLALDLALAGIGNLLIVDFDAFEEHNVTRSPLYPTHSEQEKWGKMKAKVVAHKLLPLMTAPSPHIHYAIATIQSLGSLPFDQAHIVFSAVDNQNARAYLTEQCHLMGRPLIEGGIYADDLNLSIYGPDNDDPCYRCISPQKTGAFSCTLHALMVERQQALPAIQNTAAVLAAFQAESGIQWLHSEQGLRNKYIYANIHTMKIDTLDIFRNISCPGIHQSYKDTNWPPKIVEIGGDDSVAQLMHAVQAEFGTADIRFREVFVVRHFCVRCERLTEVYTPEWYWLVQPYCKDCGGPFPLAGDYSQPSGKKGVYTEGDEEDIVRLQCKQVGLPSGTVCEIWPHERRDQLGERLFIQLRGTLDKLMEEIIASTP